MPPDVTQSRSLWLQYARQDLQATPGRLNSSLRITLTTVVVLVAMMVLQMPFVAYGLYVIFIVGRANPTVTLRTGIALFCSTSCALSIALIVVILTDNNPMARVLSLAVMTFVAGMITVATSIPSVGSGWGLIFCVGIGLWENHTPADSLVKNTLWLLAAFFTGIAAAVAVEYVFATRSPAQKLAEELRIRYRALEAMFSAYADDVTAERRQNAAERVSQLAAAGYLQMLELYAQIVDRDLDRGDLPLGVHVHITMLAELLDSSAAFGLHAGSVDAETQSRCQLVARRCRELARDVKTQESLESGARSSVEVTHLDRVESIVGCIQSLPRGDRGERPALVALPSKQIPFLIPGAILKVENIAFSLKISFCATICYILYHAIDWPGISTSVVTVMVAGLIHTGAMKQKLTLRLLGATIGALALGIGAEICLFPFMDSITSLVVVIGAIAFFCAWVAGGSRFGYFGIQMAFAFYLTDLVGFSAPTELAPARDRFVGVSLGAIVLWFVLDQIWPVRTITVMRRAVASVLQDAAGVITLIDNGLPPASYMKESNTLRDRLGKQLATLRMLKEATQYEFGTDRGEYMHLGDKFMRISMTAVALVLNHASLIYRKEDDTFSGSPALIRLRQAVAQRLTSIAGAIAEKRSLDRKDAVSNDPEFTADKSDSEYSRNAIAKLNELERLILSFEPTDLS